MRFSNIVITLSCAVANAIPSHIGKSHPSPKVTIQNGTIEGLSIPSYDQEAFLSIPFAEPPIGNRRFFPPQYLRRSWERTLQTKAYPPKCVGYGTEQVEPGVVVSEDCLYLNVVRPAGISADSGLPIAVWIYGGGKPDQRVSVTSSQNLHLLGFSQGGTMDTLYNMSFMIQNGVEINKPFIGVTLQYRLNAYGFINGEQVQDAGATNLGIRDQRLALQWVRENIGEFGGDPDKAW